MGAISLKSEVTKRNRSFKTWNSVKLKIKFLKVLFPKGEKAKRNGAGSVEGEGRQTGLACGPC